MQFLACVYYYKYVSIYRCSLARLVSNARKRSIRVMQPCSLKICATALQFRRWRLRCSISFRIDFEKVWDFFSSSFRIDFEKVRDGFIGLLGLCCLLSLVSKEGSFRIFRSSSRTSCLYDCRNGSDVKAKNEKYKHHKS
jgi:hypothetical protein